MSSVKTSPYGTWDSPLSIDLITAKSLSYGGIEAYPPTGALYWTEIRDDGRYAIVKREANGKVEDVLPQEYSARCSVHEYGGESFSITKTGNIVFVDASSDTLALLDPNAKQVSVIQQKKGLRYANFHAHPLEDHLILGIEEDHLKSDHHEDVVNRLVLINTKDSTVRSLVDDHDFFASPRFSPDGKRICWTMWDHPDMPWTGAHLFVADFDAHDVQNTRHIAGAARSESCSRPHWLPDGTLVFAWDKTGYYQFYTLGSEANAEPKHIRLEGLETAETSNPDWSIGACSWIAMSSKTLVAVVTREATEQLIVIDLPSSTWKSLGYPIVAVGRPSKALTALSDTEFVVVGTEIDVAQSIYLGSLTSSTLRTLATTADVASLKPYISRPQHLTIPRPASSRTPGNTYAFFFPPHNPNYAAPAGTLPPVIVTGHGGPTGHTPPCLTLRDQFWTSRGFASLQLNYGGSSGYGKAYRSELDNEWGVLDTDDAVTAVQYLIEKGYVDGTRVGIRGGSAGGYLVLCALTRYPNVWAGGVSNYGVGDMEMLARDTHKFEAKYVSGLVIDMDKGDPEERAKVLRERSPIHYADQITAPVLLMQGDLDMVVPLNQAQDMERIMKNLGRDVKLVVFKGEGHGFKMAESIKKSLQEEWDWWSRTLIRPESK